MANLGNLPSEKKKRKRERTSLKHLFWQILTTVAFCGNLRMTVVAKKTKDILRLAYYRIVDAVSGHKRAL